MPLQLSVAARNASLDAYETATGASPILTIRTGAPPANCAAANTGTVLATLTLPADWLTAASGGVKSLLGTWADPSADSSGTAGHFRIHDSTNTTCHWQGNVTAAGGGGVMILDNLVFAATQPFSITSFTLTADYA